MSSVIGSVHRYTGHAYPELRGHRTVVAAVIRGREVLREDSVVGELRGGDLLEVFEVLAARGAEELSLIAYDAKPAEFERTGEMWPNYPGFPVRILNEPTEPCVTEPREPAF